MKHEAKRIGRPSDESRLLSEAIGQVAEASANDIIKWTKEEDGQCSVTVRLYTINPHNVNRIIDKCQSDMELYHLIFGPAMPENSGEN